MKEKLLEGVGITKSFSHGDQSTKVLDGIDMEIWDLTVIMGSSGAGKSTLLYNLSGLDRPSGGSVFFRHCDGCICCLDYLTNQIEHEKVCGYTMTTIANEVFDIGGRC